MVSLALKQNGKSIIYANQYLNNNKQLFFIASINYPKVIFKYGSDTLKNNDYFLIHCIKYKPKITKYW